MPADTVPDPTDLGTLRPNEPAIPKPGDTFTPLQVTDRLTHIHLPNGVTPLEPFTLFELYYTLEIIEQAVEATNQYARKCGPGEFARGRKWYDTTAQEIYIFFAIRLYMMICVLPEIKMYWNQKPNMAIHSICQYISLLRFEELHIRFRLSSSDNDTYSRVEAFTNHFQDVNLRLWTPGTNLAADEIIVQFDGRSYIKTTIPNKPHPTGIKVWAIAQSNFLLVLNFHTPGDKNGPVDTKTPVELGGTVVGKGGNKTQAVVSKIINKLPQPGDSDYLPESGDQAGYHLWLDNLFTSTRFLEYMRKSYNIGITGTTRMNAGIVQPILNWIKSDKGKGKIPWGTKMTLPTGSGLVAHIAWKDQAKQPSLMMSTVYDGKKDIKSLRKRPKQGKKQEEEKHKPFKGQAIAELNIPECFDFYNHQMGPIDGFDQLTALLSGLRRIRRGAWQALEHWLLRAVLANTYVIAQIWLREGECMRLRSQVIWRQMIMDGLLQAAQKAAKGTPLHPIPTISLRKRGIADGYKCLNPKAVQTLKPKACYWCQGKRPSDRPLKRRGLQESASTGNRVCLRHESIYSCDECNTPLCTGRRGCFNRWHEAQE